MATWLVTGGLGFIGSNFIRIVLRERPGVHVINFDAMTYAGNPANVADVAHESPLPFLQRRHLRSARRRRCTTRARRRDH